MNPAPPVISTAIGRNTTAPTTGEPVAPGPGRFDPPRSAGAGIEGGQHGRGRGRCRRGGGCGSRRRRDAREGGPRDQGYIGALERRVLLDAGAPADPPLEELGGLLLAGGVEHRR